MLPAAILQSDQHDSTYARGLSYQGQSQLTNEQVELLDRLGFRWNVNEEKWMEKLEQIKQFKEQHGHCDVDLLLNKEDALLRWVKFQRNALAKGKLGPVNTI